MTRAWAWLADRIIPPAAVRLDCPCHYWGTGPLLRRLLENGALP